MIPPTLTVPSARGTEWEGTYPSAAEGPTRG
jgi:hypothetical protein